VSVKREAMNECVDFVLTLSGSSNISKHQEEEDKVD